MPKEWDGIISQSINRKFSRPLARFLADHTKVTPNQISVLSLAVSVLSGICFFVFQNLLGGLLAQISSILDGVDGDLAVLTGKASVFGGFFDSILDRYGDGAILMGMIYNVYTLDKNWVILTIALAALFGSFMVSYSRAQAKSRFGIIFKSGFSGYAANRDVRLFLIMIGGALGQVLAVLSVLAILTNFVVLMRMYECLRFSR